MSRTIRRKNDRQAFWESREWVKEQTPEEQQRFFVVFHSDKFVSMRNPGWWNKIHNTKKLRVANRKALHTFFRNGPDNYPVFYDRLRVPYYW